MFTAGEARAFVEKKLGLNNLEDRFKSDRRALLDDIVIALQATEPFTNISLLSRPLEKRQRPSLDEIKADLESGVGGLCFNLNLSTYCILKALGFDATLVSSTVTTPRDHVIVYVTSVREPGDTYLVDNGFGFPTFRAVCLDFETESPPFRDSFLEYKYLKRNGEILRMHREGDRAKGLPDDAKVYIDGWRVAYTAEMSGTNNLETFYPVFDQVFSDPTRTSFHQTFRACQFPNKRAIIISNYQLIVENEAGELETTAIERGENSLLAIVRQYFPVFAEGLVQSAIENWSRYVETS